MAGPIRQLLQRQPIRSAIRAMVGGRSRMMGDRLSSVAESDSRGLTNLLGGPRRLERREVTPVTPVSSPSMQSGVPAPEARAVAAARNDDADRRMAAQRQTEMAVPPQDDKPSQPSPLAPAAPVDPRTVRAQSFFGRAEQLRAQAEKVAQSPQFNSDGGSFLRMQYENIVMQANVAEQQGLALEAEQRQEVFAREAMKSSQESEQARLKAQFPEDNLGADARILAQTVQERGMAAGAMLATDQYFAKTNPTLPTTDPTYIARLNNYRVAAAGMTLANRVKQGQAIKTADPTLSEMAALVAEMSPRDARARAAIIRSIVASAQQQAAMPPEKAARMAELLTRMIEQQITGR
jgi:hypothetical protein